MKLSSPFVLALALVVIGNLGLRAQAVGHWTFDGDLVDSEGALDGIFFGGDEPLFVTGYDGTERGAIQFDGVDDHVQIPDDPVAPALALTNNFTLALWFKAASNDQSEKYLLSRNGGGGQYAIIYEYTEDRVDFFAPSRSSGDDPRAGGMSEMPLEDTDWHHVAYTYDGVTWSGYMDGDQVFSSDVNFVLDDLFVASWWIGSAHSSANFVAGTIDDVRIYTEALDEGDIEDLYTEPVNTECPIDGDTHCGDLEVGGPEDNRVGTYTLTATATDDSGDDILYTFTADNGFGAVITIGPQSSATVEMPLGEGIWLLSVQVDDDVTCDDSAADAECTTQVEVISVPALVSHWRFDGDLSDSEGDNDGIFFGGEAPVFVDDADGNSESAILFDGLDDYVQILPTPELAVSDKFTLALWFKPEATDQSQVYLLSRNDSILGGTGKQYAVIYEYDDDQVDFYAPQRLVGDDPRAGGASLMPLEDTGWHHIAYAYDGETWAGYMDGVQVFSTPIVFTLDNTASSSWWIGAANPLGNHAFGTIDDVRIYTYGLSAEEVAALLEDEPPPQGQFRRGDPDNSGGGNITDAIAVLNHLFAGEVRPACWAAADTNGDGDINVADPVYHLNFLFGGGGAPPAPGPDDCGPGTAADALLSCEEYTTCD